MCEAKTLIRDQIGILKGSKEVKGAPLNRSWWDRCDNQGLSKRGLRRWWFGVNGADGESGGSLSPLTKAEKTGNGTPGS